MNYSDIINIVSIKTSSVFNEKTDGRRIQESVKGAKTAPVLSKLTKSPASAETSHKFYQLKIWQRNCRGLNNKIFDLFSYSTEKKQTWL